jgi:hypothetical protein
MIMLFWNRIWYRYLIFFMTLVVFGLYIEFAPRVIEVVSLMGEIRHIEQRLDEAGSAETQIQFIAQRRNDIQADYGGVTTSGNSSPQTLLESIHQAVHSSSVQLISLRPVQTQTDLELTHSAFELNVSGGFHRQVSMINALERSQPLVSFMNIEMVADGLVPASLTGRYQIRFLILPSMP